MPLLSTFRNLLHPHASPSPGEQAPLLPEGSRGAPLPSLVGADGVVFEARHDEALRTLFDEVQALILAPARVPGRSDGLRSRSVPGSLLEPDVLGPLGDLLRVRHSAPRQLASIERDELSRAIGCDFVLLLAERTHRGALRGADVLTALSAPPSFLLKLAKAAVHDPRLSMAMCKLLGEIRGAVGQPRLQSALLALDEPHDKRPPEDQPKDMRNGHKYTSFLGRLIGDGCGEWGDDGAVHAIDWLNRHHLLPDRKQMEGSGHTSARWKKQREFVQRCEALKTRFVLQGASPPALCLRDLENRLGGLLANLSGKRPCDKTKAATHGAACDDAVSDAVDSALRKGWRQAHALCLGVLMDRCCLPEANLVASPSVDESTKRCLKGLLRLPVAPPARVRDQVLAEVLRDPTMERPLKEAAASGVSSDFRDQVDKVACRSVERLLDWRGPLSAFLPRSQVQGCKVRLLVD